MTFRVVLGALISHWRRRPGQLAALVAGLAVATALWSGVQALNAEARSSYDRAAAVLSGDQLDSLRPVTGDQVALADYIALRRAGWRVSPVFETTLPLAGQRMRLLGVDPLTLPPGALGAGQIDGAQALTAFMRPPYRLVSHPATAARLTDWAQAPGPVRRALVGADGVQDPLTDSTLPEGVLIGDIALIQTLAETPGAISYLTLAPDQKPAAAPLPEVTGDRLALTRPRSEPELARLTDSFHLNLTAFGLLSFVVGLFIVHATIGLAFEQRRGTIRTLRALGTPRRTVTGALLVELGVLATLSAALGMALGYALAAALLPDVAASLRGLYGAPVSGQLALQPAWWLAGLAMALAGTGIAAATGVAKLHRLPLLATAQAQAWRGAQIRQLRVQGLGAGALALGALGALILGDGLLAGFALMAGVLMAAALALPGLLALALRPLALVAKGPVSGWFLAETRSQIGGLSLALMALLLALSVNIGVGSMVSSFRGTFLGWLDQRLAADIYLRGTDPEQAAQMAAFLGARDDVLALLPVENTEIRIDGWPVELFGVRDDVMYRANWPLLSTMAGGAPAVWDAVADGSGILISEQAARRFDLAPGDLLPIPPTDWIPVIAGIYADYGNPLGQAITSEAGLAALFPGVERTRYAVRTAPGTAASVLADLGSAFDLETDQAINQAALKAFSRSVFERTFTVTLALNVLTFAVAGLALFTSLLTLAEMRLPQLAPVWALGMTRARLARLELARALLLALLTAVLAIPLGLLVAWILLAVVNVEAFGWRIPLGQYPGQWIGLMGLAVGTAGLAAALPAARLRRTPPALLLRIFSDER